jgi:hypothetical protein
LKRYVEEDSAHRAQLSNINCDGTGSSGIKEMKCQVKWKQQRCGVFRGTCMQAPGK